MCMCKVSHKCQSYNCVHSSACDVVNFNQYLLYFILSDVLTIGDMWRKKFENSSIQTITFQFV